MRKWLRIILPALLFVCILVYVIIPGKINISNTSLLPVPKSALYRAMIDENSWKGWWPAVNADTTGTGLVYNQSVYAVSKKTITSLFVDIVSNESIAKSSLTFIPFKPDSTKLQWDATVITSANPLKRIQAYLYASSLKKDLSVLLEKISSHYQKLENVYDVPIRKELVVDSLLVFISENSPAYPNTEHIYRLINVLKKYIADKSAKETGYPMLNITTKDSTDWLIKVAIPVDRILEPSGNITYRKMLGRGNILVGEVTGGPHSINNAFKQLENYISDYERIAPAIPFQSLVTDRMAETDTSKWITRIYYPVM